LATPAVTATPVVTRRGMVCERVTSCFGPSLRPVQALMKANNCGFGRAFLPVLVQLPMFIVFVVALRRFSLEVRGSGRPTRRGCDLCSLCEFEYMRPVPCAHVAVLSTCMCMCACVCMCTGKCDPGPVDGAGGPHPWVQYWRCPVVPRAAQEGSILHPAPDPERLWCCCHSCTFMSPWARVPLDCPWQAPQAPATLVVCLTCLTL
jgi:hypothetical protein